MWIDYRHDIGLPWFEIRTDRYKWKCRTLSPTTRSAFADFVLRYVKIFKVGFGEMDTTKISVKNCVWFVKTFGKFSRAKSSESEADVL